MQGVVGQREIGERLRKAVGRGRLAHALLFVGEEGTGKLATALWLGRLLLCRQGGDEPCGKCGACHRAAGLCHPDLHFSYPFVKRGASTVAADYLVAWRELLVGGAYFGFDDWLRVMGDEGKQALISEPEADAVLHYLGLTAFEGGRKVVIMWMAERMNSAAANNLLKMLEEPPADTFIIMIANDTRQMLPTILSRTQQIRFPRLSCSDIEEALMERNGLEAASARDVARQAAGSYLRALRIINVDSRGEEFFRRFVELMRMAWGRNVGGLETWSVELAGWSRERLRAFWQYCGRMVRESFVYNFHRPELNYMSERETEFVSRFAPFVNERNVWAISSMIGQAEVEIAGNVSPKGLLFDLAMNMIIQIRK